MKEGGGLFLVVGRGPFPAAPPLPPPQPGLESFSGPAGRGLVPFQLSGGGGGGGWWGLGPFLLLREWSARILWGGGRSGVWFFSLDAANALAVWGARRAFHLPYFLAAMRCEGQAGWIHYESARKHRGAPSASLQGRYRGIGETFTAQPGTLEHFLTERYCLYSSDRKGRIIRCEIHHPEWALQLAESSLQENTMALAVGIAVADEEPAFLHFARRQDVVVWAPRRLK